MRTRKAHTVRMVRGSWLHRVAQARRNSRSIPCTTRASTGWRPGLVAEGTAPDGTIEAVRAAAAPAFAVGVQWHPEYDLERDPVSRAIFEAFGAAIAARAHPADRAAAAD